MTRIDQFESTFKAAAKEVFAHEPVDVRKVLVATDLPPDEAAGFARVVRSFLRVLEIDEGPEWILVSAADFGSVEELLNVVHRERPDLTCTHRNLHTRAWKWTHSLGDYLNVLTQATDTPVLVVPHPRSEHPLSEHDRGTPVVVAMTDHLAGDGRLVNQAARFTMPGGTLHVTHVEDEATFERFMDVISKIPAIDTDTARQEILAQLLKEPGDYVDSCRREFRRVELPIQVEAHVTLGHSIKDHERLVEEHGADLLVLNTKDEDQFAMHGLAYPLAVQLSHVPLLML